MSISQAAKKEETKPEELISAPSQKSREARERRMVIEDVVI